MERNTERELNAKIFRDNAAEMKSLQDQCTHRRRDMSPATVYVPNGDFNICQRCRKVITRTDPSFFVSQERQVTMDIDDDTFESGNEFFTEEELKLTLEDLRSGAIGETCKPEPRL